MDILDTAVVADTQTRVKAGDPSAYDADIFSADALGGAPYAFRLKLAHPDGAMAAISRYTPWWKDLKSTWSREIDIERKKFERWNQDRFSKKEHDKAATHVAMNKGSLVVPDADEASFLKGYARCLAAGKKMYFVEQLVYPWTPPCSRLFMDLDFKQLHGITERGIEAASVVCAKTVSRFFPGRPSNTIVASTTYKNDTQTDATTGNKVSVIKTGIHLYWPSHYVSPIQALHIRESVIADLQETFGQRVPPSMNPWDDVLDSSVYAKANGKGGSGLRMIGSYKTDDCKVCKHTGKVDGAKCSACDGNGKVECYDTEGRIGRAYMLLCVLGAPNEQGHVSRDLDREAFYQAENGLEALIFDTKIRTTLTVDTLDNGFVLPAGAPQYAGPVNKKGLVKGERMAKGERHISPSDPVHLELQKIIRESFGNLYAAIVVRSVSKGKSQYTVKVSGQNNRYCQNIGREHTSNNIYFVVSRDGIAQRCYDDGGLSAEMRHGLCKNYASSTIPLGVAASAVLWPETRETLSIIQSVAASTPSKIKMRALLNVGEYLSTSLYGASWTATLGLTSKGKGLREFVPQDPRDLGTRGIASYKDLNLDWADALLALKKSGQADEGPRVVVETKKLADLYRNLFDAFDTIVMVAATFQDPDSYTAHTMDDFLGPSVESDYASDEDVSSDDEGPLVLWGASLTGARKRRRPERSEGISPAGIYTFET